MKRDRGRFPTPLLDQVVAFISRHHLLTAGDGVVVAVSGGPDSLCLLHILREIAPRFDLRLVVAHLNHALRPEAGHEEEYVRQTALRWSLPVESRTVDVRALKVARGVSEEVAGRQARYRFFHETAEKYGAEKIALGHHLDDQAETVLLNLFRGSGVDGLAGILPRSRSGGLVLIRPLLCLWQAEIEDYCAVKGLQPCRDDSNLKRDYTRNKIRNELIPLLEREYNPRIRRALCSLSHLAADDRRYLRSRAVRALHKISRVTAGRVEIGTGPLAKLSPALQGRVLRLALELLGARSGIGRKHIQLLTAMAMKTGRSRRLNLPGELVATSGYGLLVLGKACMDRRERGRQFNLPVPGRVNLPGQAVITARLAVPGELSWPPAPFQAYLDYDLLPAGELFVGHRQAGDRFYPQGAPGPKKLKDFFIDRKIATGRRNMVPLVRAAGEIIWVAGVRIAHPYRVTSRTRRVLLLEQEPSGILRARRKGSD